VEHPISLNVYLCILTSFLIKASLARRFGTGRGIGLTQVSIDVQELTYMTDSRYIGMFYMAIPLLSKYPIGSLKSLESASSYENNVTLLVDVIQFLRINQNDFYTPIVLAL